MPENPKKPEKRRASRILKNTRPKKTRENTIFRRKIPAGGPLYAQQNPPVVLCTPNKTRSGPRVFFGFFFPKDHRRVFRVKRQPNRPAAGGPLGKRPFGNAGVSQLYI